MDKFTTLIDILFVILAEFFEHILTHIAILLFDTRCDLISVLRRELFSTVFQRVYYILSDIATGQGNRLDTRANNISVTNWENVSHTVTRINDGAGHILFANVAILILGCARIISFSNLGVKGKSGLHTNKETLDVESFKHDLGDLFTIFRRVHRRFSQDKAMVFGFAFKVRMN